MPYTTTPTRPLAAGAARALAGLAWLLAAVPAAAQPPNNFSWNNTSTAWATSTSWTPAGPPSTANDFANFGPFGTAVLNPDLGAVSQTVAGLVLDTNPLGGGYTLTASGGGTLTLANPNTAGSAFQTIPGAIVVRGGTQTLANISVTIGTAAATGAPFNTAIEIASSGTLVLGSGAAVNLAFASEITEIRGSGATLVMDDTGAGPTPTLTQAGQNIRANGGGTFVFLGNATRASSFGIPQISAGPGDNNLTLNQPGAAGVTVTLAAAAGTVSGTNTSFGRFSSAATYFLSSTGTGTLGGGAGNPTVLATTAPLTFNGVMSTSSTASVPYAFVTSSAGPAVVGTFANYDPTNGVVAAVTTPRNSAQFTDTSASGPQPSENTNFQPDQATTTLTAPVTVNTLTINAAAPGQTLNLNGNSLTTTGLALSGKQGFTIAAGSATGLLFGTGTAIREIAVLDPAAALTTDASLAGGNAAVNKAGPGFLILTNTTTDQLAFATAQRVNITGGVLRVPGAFVNGTGNILSFRGGVLEVDSSANGGQTTFTRALGSAGGNVNWRGTATSFADNGSGGFSAVGGTLVVSIGGTSSPTSLIWGDSNTINGSPGDTGFFAIGSNALLFGSARSDSTVAWNNPLALDNGTANQPHQSREVRVTLGSGGPNDKTQLFGTITGSAASDLLKTGTGVLELLGINTYAGNTLVKGGTLRLSTGTAASATGTGSVLVFPGGTLGGTGLALPAAGNGVSIRGAIAPGTNNTFGTLTFGSSAAPTTVAIPGSYTAKIGPPGTNDRIDVPGGTLNINLFSAAKPSGPYTLATYNTLVGTSFSAVTGLPNGYTVQYLPTSIVLAPVPEPGFVLAACAVAGLGWYRRRPPK